MFPPRAVERAVGRQDEAVLTVMRLPPACCCLFAKMELRHVPSAALMEIYTTLTCIGRGRNRGSTTAPGPQRRFAAMQQHVCNGGRSRRSVDAAGTVAPDLKRSSEPTSPSVS